MAEKFTINTLKSSEVENIISSRPTHWVRWGSLYLFALLVAIVVFTALIEYPEIVPFNGKLGVINGPKEISAKVNGKLVSLTVKEGQEVNEGDTVGEIAAFGKKTEVAQNKYSLLAPISGTVVFDSTLLKGHNISIGEPVCYIFPDNTEYFIEANITQHYFKKIKIGQVVNLKFRDSPYQKFGTISRVNSITDNISADSGYFTRLNLLTAGLNFNYKQRVLYKKDQYVIAQVITEKRSLLKKLFYKIKGERN